MVGSNVVANGLFNTKLKVLSPHLLSTTVIPGIGTATTFIFIPRVEKAGNGQNLSRPVTVNECGNDLAAVTGGVQQNLKLSALGPCNLRWLII